jgi:hypothetical protein
MSLGYWPIEYWLLTIAGGGAVSAAIILLWAMRRRKEDKKEIQTRTETDRRWPSNILRSVDDSELRMAKDELRILEIEKEILSHSIRRIYEAEADGKINREEREDLAKEYVKKMERNKEILSKRKAVLVLNELEEMQDGFIKTFSERYEELNRRIDELRDQLNINPIQSKQNEPINPVVSSRLEKKEEKEEDSFSPNEVEEKIETIRSEVEKVLKRLEQMETET